jgi:hypothetical protein
MKKARMGHAGLYLDDGHVTRRVNATGNTTADTSGFGLVLQHLATTVETVGADVVAQVNLAGGWLNRDARHIQSIVRTVHATLGGGFFVLLDGHGGLLISVVVTGAPADPTDSLFRTFPFGSLSARPDQQNPDRYGPVIRVPAQSQGL